MNIKSICQNLSKKYFHSIDPNSPMEEVYASEFENHFKKLPQEMQMVLMEMLEENLDNAAGHDTIIPIEKDTIPCPPSF